MTSEVKRVLPTTLVNFTVVNEDKTMNEYIEAFEGVKLTEKQALKEVKKMYGERVFLNKLEIEENAYFCSVGVFIANSRKEEITKEVK